MAKTETTQSRLPPRCASNLMGYCIGTPDYLKPLHVLHSPQGYDTLPLYGAECRLDWRTCIHYRTFTFALAASN